MCERSLTEQRLAGYLGLAMRSGRMTLGGEQVLRQIRAGQAALVLIDASASENTRKKLTDACAYHRVPAATVPSGMLSDACGKPDRAAGCLKAGGLTDRISELLLGGGDAPAEKTVPSSGGASPRKNRRE